MDQRDKQNEALFEVLFNYAIKENAIRETQAIPTNTQLEKEYQLSKKFENKMKNLIRKHRNSKAMKKIYYYSKKVAVFIAVIITIGFGALMTVDAVLIETRLEEIGVTQKENMKQN